MGVNWRPWKSWKLVYTNQKSVLTLVYLSYLFLLLFHFHRLRLIHLMISVTLLVYLLNLLTCNVKKNRSFTRWQAWVECKRTLWTVRTCPTTILLREAIILKECEIRRIQKQSAFPQVVALKQKCQCCYHVTCMLPRALIRQEVAPHKKEWKLNGHPQVNTVKCFWYDAKSVQRRHVNMIDRYNTNTNSFRLPDVGPPVESTLEF